jgi:hypothetical protein
MDSGKISIPNFLVTESYTVAKISINVSNIVLYTSADIFVTFYDDKERFVKHKTLRLEGEDYALWGSNDNYIIEWILKQENIN